MNPISIPGFDGYLVTESGVIISRHGRPSATYRDKDGYQRVALALGRGKDAKRITRGVHQLVCLAFHGPCPAGMEVRHIDGDSGNNQPSNVCYSSHIDNIRDKHIHGTMPRGESHPMAKLTAAEAFSIRAYAAMGITHSLIAGWFGVSKSIVSLIHLQKVWRCANVA